MGDPFAANPGYMPFSADSQGTILLQNNGFPNGFPSPTNSSAQASFMDTFTNINSISRSDSPDQSSGSPMMMGGAFGRVRAHTEPGKNMSMAYHRMHQIEPGSISFGHPGSNIMAHQVGMDNSPSPFGQSQGGLAPPHFPSYQGGGGISPLVTSFNQVNLASPLDPGMTMAASAVGGSMLHKNHPGAYDPHSQQHLQPFPQQQQQQQPQPFRVLSRPLGMPRPGRRTRSNSEPGQHIDGLAGRRRSDAVAPYPNKDNITQHRRDSVSSGSSMSRRGSGDASLDLEDVNEDNEGLEVSPCPFSIFFFCLFFFFFFFLCPALVVGLSGQMAPPRC
jgi:hypothetical protein